MPTESPTECVRASTAAVMAGAVDVRIDQPAVDALAAQLNEAPGPPGWDSAVHYVDDGPGGVQYLLVLDALNFCFWPDPDLGYSDLSLGLRRAVERSAGALEAERLVDVTADDVAVWFGRPVWHAEGRAELVRQLGRSLIEHYEGRADILVRSAGASADALVGRLVADVPGFDDSLAHAGRRTCFHKRAQIFAADVWGAFGGRGIGEFSDISSLTTFADYRIPQVLRHFGAIKYAPALAARVDALIELESGGREEIEIRSATVQAVEALRAALSGRGRALTSVELDWWLWHIGEGQAAAGHLAPHHRVRTIAY